MQHVDEDIRHEYEEALRRAPQLVSEESPFLIFLQTAEYNPQSAAERLALYWKYRKNWFGDRWLLPLDQTGDGALSLSDIATLHTGYIIYHPRLNKSPVILIDLSRISHQDTPTEIRIWYYLLHAFRIDERVRLPGEGAIVVHVVTSAPRPAVNLDQQLTRIMAQALPARIQQVMVVQSWQEGRERLIESLAFQQAMVSNHRCGAPPILVSGNSVAEIVQNLQERGVEKECLPSHMGGGFHYSSFAEWNRMQLDLENRKMGTPVIHTQHNVPPNVTMGPVSGPVASFFLPPFATAAAAATTTTFPLVDERKPASMITTNPAFTINTNINHFPNIRNPRVDSSRSGSSNTSTAASAGTTLAAAFALATTSTGGSRASSSSSRTTSPKPKKRPDYYARQNEEIKSLHQRVDFLRAQNTVVRQENKRLDSLIGQARHLLSPMITTTSSSTQDETAATIDGSSNNADDRESYPR